jgi:hypothetical protein
MGLLKDVGLWVIGKIVKLATWRVGRARLDITGLSSRPTQLVLPDDYRDQSYFPRLADVADASVLPCRLKQFAGRTFHVRNKGQKKHAESCEVEAFLITTGGVLPIIAYWTEQGEREFVNIPPRETRQFIPFLVAPGTHEILFCTWFYPNYREAASWQFSLPIGSSFSLDIKVKSYSAGTCRKVFYFSPGARSVSDIRIESVREIPTRNQED